MATSMTLSLLSPSTPSSLSSNFSGQEKNPKKKRFTKISFFEKNKLREILKTNAIFLERGTNSNNTVNLTSDAEPVLEMSKNATSAPQFATSACQFATSASPSPMGSFATSACALLAAAAILAATPGDATAANTSGRVGGSAFRSNQNVRIDNSRTEVYVNPSPTVIVAPPVVVAPVVAAPVYGFVPAVPFGGWAPAPISFGPTFVVSGSTFITFFLVTLGITLVFALVSSFSNRRDDYY